MSKKFEKSLFKIRRFIFFAVPVLILCAVHNAFACADESADARWIEQTIRVWQKTRQTALRLRAEKLPWLILFDESCVYHINPEPALLNSAAAAKIIPFDRKIARVYLLKHDGKIALPNAQEIPAQLLSFASVYGDGKKSFFVAAMPSVWQKEPNLKDEKNLDALVKSVFMHEMTHTLHRNFYARLDEIEKRLTDVKNLNDDIIQNTFQTNDEFRTAFETEHALLYKAVEEPNISRKRELAKEFLASIKSRRKRFFIEKDEVYAEIEEIFLTMEGAANWTAYKAAMLQGLNQADALKLIRRGGKYWSQDEGLALFLLIDALLPNWQKKAFGKSAATVTDLLAEAVR